MQLAQKLYELFAGSEKGHGEFVITGAKGAKTDGKATTVAKPVTPSMWRLHLEGKKGIGVIPINGDNMCRWGVVDIDSYVGFSVEDFEAKFNKFPVVFCRSKSGGAHVFLFCTDYVPARLMRSKLIQLAAALGYPGVEVFPKQDKLGPQDLGNWLNMPYFDQATTLRYCVRKGKALKPEAFIDFATESMLTPDELEQLAFYDDNEFADAPPCLQHYVEQGFPDGSRNHALFSMAVYAKKKFPDGIWETKVMEYNNRFMGPGSFQEVQGVVKSMLKKSYAYKCKDQPLCIVCNADECDRRKYGMKTVKEDNTPCFLDRVDLPVKCYIPPAGSDDEPYWEFHIDDQQFDVTVSMIENQAAFIKAYLKKFHELLPPVKPQVWLKRINHLIHENAEKHHLAPDAGPEGQFWVHLEHFCTGKVQARHRDEVAMGRPFVDDEDGKTYFRSKDLLKYLEQQKFRDFTSVQIYRILKRRGGGTKKLMIKGRCVSAWIIPSFQEQTEDFDRPAPLDEEDKPF